jgi:hypothetical protein
MKISDGTEAEKWARILFHKQDYDIQIPDFVAIRDGKIILVEVKDKEHCFKAPPFDGHGLDISQVDKRLKIFFELNVDTYVIVFDHETNLIYGNYLTNLEAGEKFDTKFGVRIYKLETYNKIGTMKDGKITLEEIN